MALPLRLARCEPHGPNAYVGHERKPRLADEIAFWPPIFRLRACHSPQSLLA